MRVLLTGGTGYIGSTVLARLIEAGHDVTAVVRSEESGGIVAAAGATPVLHELTDVTWLTDQLGAVDAAIHTAASEQDAAAFDDAVIDAVTAAFAGTDKSYVHTGGIWVFGNGDDITEDSPLDPPELTAWRVSREERLLASDVKASVVAPGIVYGYGKGISNVITSSPHASDGALKLIGTGDEHWVTVHVDDLADLYLAVLEQAPGGETYVAASGTNPTVREIALAAIGADGAIEPEEPTMTDDRLGRSFAEALRLDQQASGAKARSAFAWAPSRPTLVEELSSQS